MATNGPHCWGNSPQPRGKAWRAKNKTKDGGCAVTAIAIVGGTVVAAGSLAAVLVRALA